MTHIREAVAEVLRVRDAERVGDASTEDLLDAITGLEDAFIPDQKYGDSDFDELLFAIDLAYDALTQKPKPDIHAAVSALNGQLDYYTDEPVALTRIRYMLRPLGYDMLSPMLPQMPAYHLTVSVGELAQMEPLLKDINAEEQWEVVIREAQTNDLLPLMEVIVKRTEETSDEVQAA